LGREGRKLKKRRKGERLTGRQKKKDVIDFFKFEDKRVFDEGWGQERIIEE